MTQRQVYVVGGAVRNALMGLPINDMDYVVVGATPEEMLAEGYQQVGADFPVFLKDGCEYALARTERKKGEGYHGFEVDASPEVTLEDDLIRRDLTVNAMAVQVEYWRPFLEYLRDGRDSRAKAYVHDYSSGEHDLEHGLVRPCRLDTFVEDPLRVLRAARFAAAYDMDWTREMRVAAAQVLKSGELGTIPAERWVLEIEKALKQCKTAGAVHRFAAYLYQMVDIWSPVANYVVTTVMQGCANESTSLGMKLLALAPSDDVVNKLRDKFGISNLMVDQMQMAMRVKDLMLVMPNDRFPMYNIDGLTAQVTDLWKRIEKSKDGAGADFVEDMAVEFPEGDKLIDLLGEVAQVFCEVRFDTVEMPEGTQPNMYGRLIDGARHRAVREILKEKNLA